MSVGMRVFWNEDGVQVYAKVVQLAHVDGELIGAQCEREDNGECVMRSIAQGITVAPLATFGGRK